MGSPTLLPPQMSSYTNLLRLSLFFVLGGVILGTTMSGVSTRDRRCCPYKTVSSGTPGYEGTYRLIPDEQIYVDDLPEECSYSCVYMKDGNTEDQFCFHATDPSTSDTFSQCEAAPTGLPSTSPLLTTPSPSQSPGSVSTQSKGLSPVAMSTTTSGKSPVQMSTTIEPLVVWTSLSPGSVSTQSKGQSPVSLPTMTTSPGQSPVAVNTTTTGQSPVPMSTTTPREPSITMTTATTGQSPVPMTTSAPAVSLFTPVATREEEPTTTRRPTMSVSASMTPIIPTGEEEVQLRPRIRRSTTMIMPRGRK